ncbi:hypothetical protein D3C78_671910 [compost metagenome]
MESRSHPQGGNHKAFRSQAEVRLSLIGNELRVSQNQACLFHTLFQSALDLFQAGGRLGRGVVHVGQVVQGNDGRALERQWPQTRFVIQVDGTGTSLIEAPLLQPASRLIGTGDLSQHGADTRVAGHRGLWQVFAPTPAVEQRQFNARLMAKRIDQLSQIMADAGAWGLQDPGIKGNLHAASQPPPGFGSHDSGCARSVARLPRASRATAIR